MRRQTIAGIGIVLLLGIACGTQDGTDSRRTDGRTAVGLNTAALLQRTVDGHDISRIGVRAFRNGGPVAESAASFDENQFGEDGTGTVTWVLSNGDNTTIGIMLVEELEPGAYRTFYGEKSGIDLDGTPVSIDIDTPENSGGTLQCKTLLQEPDGSPIMAMAGAQVRAVDEALDFAFPTATAGMDGSAWLSGLPTGRPLFCEVLNQGVWYRSADSLSLGTNEHGVLIVRADGIRPESNVDFHFSAPNACAGMPREGIATDLLIQALDLDTSEILTTFRGTIEPVANKDITNFPGSVTFSEEDQGEHLVEGLVFNETELNGFSVEYITDRMSTGGVTVLPRYFVRLVPPQGGFRVGEPGPLDVVILKTPPSLEDCDVNPDDTFTGEVELIFHDSFGAPTQEAWAVEEPGGNTIAFAEINRGVRTVQVMFSTSSNFQILAQTVEGTSESTVLSVEAQ